MHNAAELVELTIQMEKATKRLKRMARACAQAPAMKEEAAHKREEMENALAVAKSEARMAIEDINDSIAVLGRAMKIADIPGAE